MEDITLPNASTRHTPANHNTTCPQAEAQHRQAKTWWLTGLSGAGKSTLTHALCHGLLERGETACILDGDELRRHPPQDMAFSDSDRQGNAWRAAAFLKNNPMPQKTTCTAAREIRHENHPKNANHHH